MSKGKKIDLQCLLKKIDIKFSDLIYNNTVEDDTLKSPLLMIIDISLLKSDLLIMVFQTVPKERKKEEKKERKKDRKKKGKKEKVKNERTMERRKVKK